MDGGRPFLSASKLLSVIFRDLSVFISVYFIDQMTGSPPCGAELHICYRFNIYLLNHFAVGNPELIFSANDKEPRKLVDFRLKKLTNDD